MQVRLQQRLCRHWEQDAASRSGIVFIPFLSVAHVGRWDGITAQTKGPLGTVGCEAHMGKQAADELLTWASHHCLGEAEWRRGGSKRLPCISCIVWDTADSRCLNRRRVKGFFFPLWWSRNAFSLITNNAINYTLHKMHHVHLHVTLSHGGQNKVDLTARRRTLT